MIQKISQAVGPMSKKPEPIEKKPVFSLLSQSIFLPGAVIAGIFIFIATGFGIFRVFSISRRKKDKAKQTTLDR